MRRMSDIGKSEANVDRGLEALSQYREVRVKCGPWVRVN